MHMFVFMFAECVEFNLCWYECATNFLDHSVTACYRWRALQLPWIDVPQDLWNKEQVYPIPPSPVVCRCFMGRESERVCAWVQSAAWIETFHYLLLGIRPIMKVRMGRYWLAGTSFHFVLEVERHYFHTIIEDMIMHTSLDSTCWMLVSRVGKVCSTIWKSPIVPTIVTLRGTSSRGSISLYFGIDAQNNLVVIF